MSESPNPYLEELRHTALEVTSTWNSAKAMMALRAAGLDPAHGERASLDAIAADVGVSRETVRRARNELLNAIEPTSATTSGTVYSSLSLHPPSEPSADSPATARALRRLLTMTGPLPWDEVLNAWARAGGRPPYSPLPADIALMRTWASEAGGFSVSAPDSGGRPLTIASVLPEELDLVSQFLLDALRDQPGGVARSGLFEAAAGAGLKPTTIATTLSTHPAVRRVGRGMWALRGGRQEAAGEPARVAEPRRARRPRPTTFAWSADGSLMIEFSVPRSPSPVVTVPKAVSEFVEGREFRVDEGEKPMRVAVGNARLWGFGPQLSELRLPVGARATIALNLLAGTATITPIEEKGTSR